jgi:signal transduction histidine kinase
MEKSFRVFTANGVAQAMAILEDPASRVGVVITDQRMPGRSGVELLTELRQRWPAIVRILITAYTEIEDAVAAVNAGAVYKYINKPAEFTLLRQVLTEGLAIHKQTIDRDALEATLAALATQRQATLASESKREELQQKLVDASRDAGRAEVATGILHNVGNVLNSVNVAAAMVNKTLTESKVGNLIKALELINEHTADLADFFKNDPRGQRLPGYFQKLSLVIADEHRTALAEMESLGRNLEHIGRVVQMQQAYAKGSTVKEPVAPAELMENAVGVNRTSFSRQSIDLVRDFEELPPLLLDKHRVLQILINLIGNAANALADHAPDGRRVTLSVKRVAAEGTGCEQVMFVVTDNGSGISPENLTKIFVHGFTTKKDGHGFGLHSSANAAREMGGSLSVSSPGVGLGATFTLMLPLELEKIGNGSDTAFEKRMAA